MLEEKATRLEMAYVANPDPDHYQAWQQTLHDLSTTRLDQMNKAFLYSAQKVFEYGDKNGRLLAWLANGQIPSTPIGCIKHKEGHLLSSPDLINACFFNFLFRIFTLQRLISHNLSSALS